jgi:hypothetical protein
MPQPPICAGICDSAEPRNRKDRRAGKVLGLAAVRSLFALAVRQHQAGQPTRRIIWQACIIAWQRAQARAAMVIELCVPSVSRLFMLCSAQWLRALTSRA